jgi:uncharacterized protein YndB with AHSA1/START domain
MSLTYVGSDHSQRGKTSEHTDVVRARFLELIPDERIVQLIEFESEDPAFAGPMTITWSLADVPAGTEVTVLCGAMPPLLPCACERRANRSPPEVRFGSKAAAVMC